MWVQGSEVLGYWFKLNVLVFDGLVDGGEVEGLRLLSLSLSRLFIGLLMTVDSGILFNLILHVQQGLLAYLNIEDLLVVSNASLELPLSNLL